jgi:hypothetical protein
MYKILHKLFGWDYIHWQNVCDRGIARAHLDAENKPYFWKYKMTGVLEKITSAEQVTWLTCKPEKYIS